MLPSAAAQVSSDYWSAPLLPRELLPDPQQAPWCPLSGEIGSALSADWPPGFLEDTGYVWQQPEPALQQTQFGAAPVAAFDHCSKEVAANPPDYQLLRRTSDPRASDASDAEVHDLHGPELHVSPSVHLPRPYSFGQHCPGPFPGVPPWPDTCVASDLHGRVLSFPPSLSRSARTDDDLDSSCTSSSSSSLVPAKDLQQCQTMGQAHISETLTDTHSGRPMLAKDSIGITSSDYDSLHSCYGGDDSDEADSVSNDMLPHRPAPCMQLRRRRQARRCVSHGRTGSRRKQHNPWMVEETRALVAGMQCCGVGKWADIKRLELPGIAKRSAVDLKDKWRNLVRLAALPSSHSRAKVDKRREVPLDVLHEESAQAFVASFSMC